MKKILISLVVLSHYVILAQNIDKNRDNVWCLGYGTIAPLNGKMTVDFSNGFPFSTYIGGNTPSLYATNASISDTSGNLIFYTNGIKVINKNHALMENGDSLNYGTNTFSNHYNSGGYNNIQSTIILNLPESKDIYYIIHTPDEIDLLGEFNIPFVYYSIVDMSKNGGLGKVTRKNQVLISDTMGSTNVISCRHANGRDWWLLFKEKAHHRFYRVLLSPKGIETLPQKIDFGGDRMDLWCQSVFSPDGKTFIQGGLESGTMQSPFHLHKYDFDRCTGMLSNYWHVQDNEPWLYTGCAVSPNSKYLYYSSHADKVYQLDLQANDIMASRQLVAVMDTAYVDSVAQIYGSAGFSTMQLGPDDKIYVNAASRSLHIIDQPDSAGIACNVIRQGIALPAINQLWCIPNFPYFRLGAEVGTLCDSLTTVSIAPEFPDILARVYPNPARSSITITLHTTDNAQFYLQDIQGKEVLQASVRGNQQISVVHLPEGLYFYKIAINNKYEYGKLWIVR